MKFPKPAARAAARTLAAALAALGLAMTGAAPAGASAPEGPVLPPAAEVEAERTEAETQPLLGQTEDGGAAGTLRTKAGGGKGGGSSISGSLLMGANVGIGTFYGGPQNQPAVSTVVAPRISWAFADNMSLAASMSFVWFPVNDFQTPFFDNQVIWSDPYVQIAHNKVFQDKDAGVTINAALRVYGGASQAAQIQTRRLSIRPQVGVRWSKGPVTLSYTFLFMKFFTEKTTQQLDCSGFENEKQCIEGRDGQGQGMPAGLISERRGGAVTLPSLGVLSFYVANTVAMTVNLGEGFNATLGVALYNLFGITQHPVDDFSSVNAKSVRNQTDRLITSLTLSYQIVQNLGVSLDLTTDTIRPFGADGNGFSAFDLSRGNITTVGLAFIASL